MIAAAEGHGTTMKIALLVNRENFENYSSWGDTGWELIHMGNGAPDKDALISTRADALIVDAVVKIGKDVIDDMPGLKMIHSQGVAFNAIDVEAARKGNVYVCNNAGMNARAVAEQAALLILSLVKSFRRNEDMVYAGRQMEAKTACFVNGLPELFGRSVGIVGLGAIGGELCAILKAFGCRVFYFNSSGDKKTPDAEYLPLEELYTRSDIVSLHAPVTEATTDMINSETLKLFKHGALLINTARGELVDHAAVVDALKSGRLGGFGTDTLAPEPVLAENPLLRALPEELRSRVALSPHIAGITAGFFTRAYAHIRKNIEAIASGGKPDCIVNGL